MRGRPCRGSGGKEPAEPQAGVDELERLARLRSEELLTEEEYAAAKGRILAAGKG